MSSFYGNVGIGEGSGGSGEGLAGLTIDGRAVQTEDDKIRFQSDVDRFDYLTVGTRIANSTLGLNSVATGTSNTASGNFSSANGQQTVASQQCAHAEGNNTTASGFAAHAEGTSTVASNSQSHAEGFTTTASGYSAHAEGYGTTASTDYAHAEGLRTNAIGYGTHAEGLESEASGRYSHAENGHTTASAEYAHAEGYHTTASGTQSHAEGNNSMASGSSSHVEGRDTEASNEAGHAEGYATLSQGSAAHAEGKNTTASGQASHAEGYSSTTGSAGQFAHAEGWSTNASGLAAHAEGYNTSAFGEYSHVQGEGTGAASSSQHVSGRYNILDNNGVYAEIVGNGTGFSADSNFRSNARTLDWNGNAVYTGKVTAGVGPINSMDLTTKLYVDNLITNVSGGTAYSVELSEPEVRIPLNFGQVDYWYQGGDAIGPILLPNGKIMNLSEVNTMRSAKAVSENSDLYTTDPSEPNKTYSNPNLPETVSWIAPFNLLYKTYRGNEIVPGYLQSMRIVYSAGADFEESKTITAPFVKDVFIMSSIFSNDLEVITQQDGWVGWFSGFAYFVTPEELQEAIIEPSSSSSSSEAFVDPVRTDVSPFFGRNSEQAFLTLELTFNIENHLITKILPIHFINSHQPVYIFSEESKNYGIMIRPYPNTSYYIDGRVAALGIVPPYQNTYSIPMPFEVVFDTLSLATFDEENFHLPGSSDSDSYHIPKWFQLYPDTRYDISYDIMGNMTFASWDISNRRPK